jgi:hypothetical protein
MSDYDEPAFPQTRVDAWDKPHVFDGMTLRDYFAGQALAGIMAATTVCDPEAVASRAYVVADAMLKER